MQTVDSQTSALLSAYNRLYIHLLIDDAEYTGDVGNVTYTAAIGGGDGFTIGNAAASSATVILPGATIKPDGQRAELRWSVGDDPYTYPLISGIVTESKRIGGSTTITIHDAMYTVGVNAYTVSDALAGGDIVTAYAVLEDAAQQMGVSLVAGASENALRSFNVAEYIQSLSGSSLSSVAGEIALTVGKNAVINRSGELCIVDWNHSGGSASFITADGYTLITSDNQDFVVGDYSGSGDSSGLTTYDVYSGGSEASESEYGVTGVKLVNPNSDTGESYTAGDTDGLTQESVMASDAVAVAVLDTLANLRWRAGSYKVPGGILLEPGDIIGVTTEDGTFPVCGHQIALNIDGGCYADIVCLGKSPAESGGQTGSVNRQLTTITADIVETKRLIADSIQAVTARIESLMVDIIKSPDFQTIDVEPLLPAFLPGEDVMPSDGEAVISGFAIDLANATIYGAFYSAQIAALEERVSRLEASTQAATMEVNDDEQ